MEYMGTSVTYKRLSIAAIILIAVALAVSAALIGVFSGGEAPRASALESQGVKITAPDSVTATYNGSGIAYRNVVVTHYDSVVPADEYDVFYNGSAELPVNAGTYTVTVSVPVEDPEVNQVTADFTLTIEPAPVKVFIQGANVFTYSGNTVLRTISVTGVLQKDLANVGIVTTYTDRDKGISTQTPVDAGVYDMSFVLDGVSAANYTISQISDDRVTDPGTLTVLKRALTVSANSAEAVFGSPVPELTYTISGFVGDDNAEDDLTELPTISSSATSVGVHTITPSGGASENYTLNYVSGTLTINATSVSVQMPDSAVTMDITGVFAPGTEYSGNIYDKDGDEVKDLKEHIRNYRVADWTSILEAVFYYGPVSGGDKTPDDQPLQITLNNLSLDASKDYFIVVVDSYGVVTKITKYSYLNGDMSFDTYASDGAIMIYSAFHNTIIISLVVCGVVLFLILLMIAAAVKYRNDKAAADEKKLRKKNGGKKYKW